MPANANGVPKEKPVFIPEGELGTLKAHVAMKNELGAIGAKLADLISHEDSRISVALDAIKKAHGIVDDRNYELTFVDGDEGGATIRVKPKVVQPPLKTTGPAAEA